MKKLILSVSLLVTANGCYACLNCNRDVQNGIFDDRFYPTLFTILISFLLISIIIIFLIRLAITRSDSLPTFYRPMGYPSPVPLTSAGIILGMGVGGLIDGILLHQILQWHGMLTRKIPPHNLTDKSINMFWDGIFHCFTLATAVIGIYLLWRLSRRTNYNNSGYLLMGGMLSGWGLFNCIEGIINHHLLKLHNVRELSPYMDSWNYGFLLLGGIFLISGRLLILKGQRHKE
jgi:uncharacterized membrane protein